MVPVIFGVEQDLDGPSFPLLLAMTYLAAAAMARRLASPARYESRDFLTEFFAQYIEEILLYYKIKTEAYIPN